MSGIYGRIFAATSKRMAAAGQKGAPPISPLALWAVPGGVFATWLIWEALTDDIKASVGLYIDPDRVVNRVQAEKDKRLAAREAAKAPSASAAKATPVAVEEEEEEEDAEEEAVSHEEIVATVQAVVEQSGGDDEDDDEEEEEAPPKKKKIKKKPEEMTNEEMWESFNESAMVGSDDDDEVSTGKYAKV